LSKNVDWRARLVRFERVGPLERGWLGFDHRRKLSSSASRSKKSV
jgi:hypothetical protein